MEVVCVGECNEVAVCDERVKMMHEAHHAVFARVVSRQKNGAFSQLHHLVLMSAKHMISRC